MRLSEVNPTPKYPVTIPSTKKKAQYRPFVVKEERALLAAQESEDLAVMLETLKQIVQNCVIPASAVDDMTSFDLEYLFTLIRAKSVGEFSELIFRCDTCTEEKAKAKVSLDLRTVEVATPEGHTNKIKISDTITVLMKYPTMDELIEVQNKAESGTAKELAVASAIETIFVEDDVYHIKEEPESEVIGFLNKLTSAQFSMLEKFFDTMPVAQIKVKYTCPVCSKEHNKVVKGLNNFF
jgi:uncharacterized protein YfkK (UPF0435 family)